MGFMWNSMAAPLVFLCRRRQFPLARTLKRHKALAARGAAATQEVLEISIGVVGLFLFFLAIGYLGALDRERRAVRRSHHEESNRASAGLSKAKHGRERH